MARPARAKRQGLWGAIALTSMSVVFVGWLAAWLFVPDWLAPWWGFAIFPLIVILVLVMCRVERWFWSQPWAYRDIR